MFKFRLQSVLDYRKQAEENLRYQFADVKRRLNYEREMLERFKIKRFDLIGRLKEMRKGKFHPVDISLYFSRIDHMKNQEGKQQETVFNINGELEEKRSDLTDAVKKRKMLEIIKEKKLQEYRMCMAGKERKELDELGIKGRKR